MCLRNGFLLLLRVERLLGLGFYKDDYLQSFNSVQCPFDFTTVARSGKVGPISQLT